MIRLAPQPTLPPEHRNALSVLAECSRLLLADVPDAVEIRVVGGVGPAERLDPAAHLRVREGAVEIGENALALVTRITAAVDEQRSTSEDRFGRVPPTDNYLAARGLEREPVVDRFATALRTAVVSAAGGRPVALWAPWPRGKRWAMAMTHDLDVVALWPVFTALRAAELAGKGRLGAAASVLARALASAGGNPVSAAARHVLDVERRHGIPSTWFIITGTPTFATMRAGDVTYSPESRRATALVRAARDHGHEIGLHGSFETWTHADRFRAQRQRLERIVGRPAAGVRQHFIRMRPGKTQEAMRVAGFSYDSTFGFADRNGFRLGVAQPLPFWDDASRQTQAIDTVPFVWMDRALSKYRRIEEPGKWVADALVLAHVCREVEGVWTGIWHPNLSAPLGYPGAPEAFEELCERLMALDPWAAPLGEIVEWRKSRRSLRAVGIGATGEIRVASQDPSTAVPLEDHAGRPMPSVPA